MVLPQTGCTGKRNRVPYVTIHQFDDRVVLNGQPALDILSHPSLHYLTNAALAVHCVTDYYFLEDVVRSSDSARRLIREYGSRVPHGGRGKHKRQRRPPARSNSNRNRHSSAAMPPPPASAAASATGATEVVDSLPPRLTAGQAKLWKAVRSILTMVVQTEKCLTLAAMIAWVRRR